MTSGRRFPPLAVLAVACALSVSAPASAAPIVGVTISNDGLQRDNLAWNLGYSFVVDFATSVVSLGVWDQGSDGLINRHEVGLWNSSGVLLASAFVGAGTAGILDSGFRFTDIVAVALSVGSIYYVAATFNGPDDDIWVADPTSLVTASQISYDSRRFQSGSSLVFPDLAGTNTTGYWGGNVRLDSTAVVPEPSTWLLFSAGLAGVAIRRRRKS